MKKEGLEGLKEKERVKKPEELAMHTGRGIDYMGTRNELSNYPEVFGFGSGTVEENKQIFLDWIKGKKILDAGSGLSNFFHDLYSRYITQYEKKDRPFLVSMEPYLSDPGFRQKTKDSALLRMRHIQGFDGEEAEKVFAAMPLQKIAARWPSDFEKKHKTGNNFLAFQDNSFDIVLSGYSFPFWMMDSAEVPYVLREFYRILKSGGEIRFAPIMKDQTVINARLWREGGNEEKRNMDTMSADEFAAIAREAGFDISFTNTNIQNADCMILKKIKEEK